MEVGDKDTVGVGWGWKAENRVQGFEVRFSRNTDSKRVVKCFQ